MEPGEARECRRRDWEFRGTHRQDLRAHPTSGRGRDPAGIWGAPGAAQHPRLPLPGGGRGWREGGRGWREGRAALPEPPGALGAGGHMPTCCRSRPKITTAPFSRGVAANQGVRAARELLCIAAGCGKRGFFIFLNFFFSSPELAAPAPPGGTLHPAMSPLDVTSVRCGVKGWPLGWVTSPRCDIPRCCPPSPVLLGSGGFGFCSTRPPTCGQSSLRAGDVSCPQRRLRAGPQSCPRPLRTRGGSGGAGNPRGIKSCAGIWAELEGWGNTRQSPRGLLDPKNGEEMVGRGVIPPQGSS